MVYPNTSEVRVQISNKLYEPYIREVPLFRGCSDGFIKKIVRHICYLSITRSVQMNLSRFNSLYLTYIQEMSEVRWDRVSIFNETCI